MPPLKFGETHTAIKQFFPRAQLFGFTGTPIFEQNATVDRREGDYAYKLTTKHLFPHELHRYTISNAIDDRNVLGFQVEYYKPDGKHAVTAGETLKKQKVVEEILAKHDKATLDRRFNALLATNSIPDAIEYVECFRAVQAERASADPSFLPLNIACIFSPPPSPAKDSKPGGEDLAEDLPQEQKDNQHDPAKKREALTEILTEYNTRFSTNHRLDDFYAYYRDVQKRIKNQKLSSADLPRTQKIDVCIVVDMLLTGFDSQYLKVLYVDKWLKHHGLIQAFSRTNRILNDTKPWGAIVDFRGQEEQVNEAMVLFSGEPLDRAQTIWLVDSSPVVLDKLKQAVAQLTSFMESQGLKAKPEDVANLKGDTARAGFVERFAEVQKFSNQLDQYTDLAPEQEAEREQVMPISHLQGFRTQYLETVRRLREETPPGATGPVAELDFNLVLFSSAKIDYDFIMALVAKGGKPEQIKASREQAKRLLAADSKFDDPEEISAYIDSLELRKYDENELRQRFEQFKAERKLGDLEHLSNEHKLPAEAVKSFVEEILDRRIFDGERLTDLFAVHDLPWKERARREHLLMTELKPLLLKWSTGREIAGLRAYE
jgi:type I restriction enzyme R subunit